MSDHGSTNQLIGCGMSRSDSQSSLSPDIRDMRTCLSKMMKMMEVMIAGQKEFAENLRMDVASIKDQVYKGLDVVTAKATVQEREMARHHLLDLLEPHQMFTVVDFRNRALKIIDNLIEQGKTAIIVGGTMYYIESIVYKILVEDMDDEHALLWEKSRRKRDYDDEGNNPKKLAVETNDKQEEIAEESKVVPSSSENSTKDISEDTNVGSKEQVKNFVDKESNFTNEEVHAQLKAIDPVMAARLHPNNRRKILRSIEVWLKSGRRHSEVLAEQKETEGELRRPGATVILWLKCEQAAHDKRLDDRVDKMLEEGLIEELLDFHARHNKQRMKDGTAPDYTKGVFQTLGFKEFHDYLMMSGEERNSEEGRKLLEESIENMKRGTRRYARRQNKIVRGRFLEHPGRQVPPIYELDTTDVSKWDENVKTKAIHIIESYINNTSCNYKPLDSKLTPEARNVDGNSYNYCDICERVILGDNVYAIHLKSHRHMRALKKKKKLAQGKTNAE